MQRGFTLIELMIVLAIVGILLAVALPLFTGDTTYTSKGMVERKCLDGYRFMVDTRGTLVQVIDERGRGVRCN